MHICDFFEVAGSGYDYTSLPQKLQDAFDKHGGENTLRPTIVTVSRRLGQRVLGGCEIRGLSSLLTCTLFVALSA